MKLIKIGEIKMTLVIITGLFFILFIFLAVYGFKKEHEDLGVYSLVMSLFIGVFLVFTLFIFPLNKEDVRNSINYYNSLKEKVEILKELDPECKDIVTETFVPGLELEVEKMNDFIEFNRSRIGTWNEYFISKDIANLEKIKY